MADVQKMEVGEAVARFLSRLSPGEKSIGQHVLFQFERWFGQGRCLDGLAAAEVEKFYKSIPGTDAIAGRKLEILKRFLEDARKNSWTETNLSAHVKVKKGKSKLGAGANHAAPDSIYLTKESLEGMKQEIVTLKEKRVETIEDIRRAAADKDFRENAPLDAAREQLGHIDGRIRELEETLKVACLAENRPQILHIAGVGDTVDILCLDTAEELHYTLVSPREVNPAKGKISGFSPLGKAIVGHGPGDIIEISVPAGKIKYRINNISGR